MTPITVTTTINAPVEKVWAAWTEPEDIMQWCFASDEWHAPKAENDLRTGGKFVTTMAAKDGSVSFDFGGTYTAVTTNELIEYSLDDNRKVRIEFASNGGTTTVTETFDPEGQNPVEMQQAGWQIILDNFRKHAEK